jgi:hypothetical protein
MYCTKCGTSRPDGMTVCPNCGTVAPAFSTPAPPVITSTVEGPKIQNYLVPSILVTLCCCVPAGIVAIVYAAQVNSKLAAGDFTGAQESARLAKIWCWVAFGIGALIGIVYGILGAMGALSNMH